MCCICASVYGYEHMRVDAHKCQKRASAPLGWELQVV